tara:strand:- start:704 stop:1558 length:855 start_codon:yes stop_codon:yes gene_type:complete
MIDTFEHISLLKKSIKTQVTLALTEDIGSGDITGNLIDNSWAQAKIISREEAVFCGKPWIEEICKRTDQQIETVFHLDDGQMLSKNDVVVELAGPARALLEVERTTLNFLQLLSGTATTTRNYVDVIKDLKTQLLDTRKTIPGLRLAQKYAVHCGGGKNHRVGLFDAFLLKENHIQAAGGLKKAVHSAMLSIPNNIVEVEVENLEELSEAIDAGAHIVLLDNFSLADTAAAVKTARGKVKLEASGNISLQNIRLIAETGIDYISVGAITKNIKSIDLSMLFVAA